MCRQLSQCTLPMYRDTAGNALTYKPNETSKSCLKRVFFPNDKNRSRSDYSKRSKDDARKDGQDGRKYGGQSSIMYLCAVICKCDDADRNALHHKCCLSINEACATPVYVLFDTGADPISFVNRKVATWIRTQKGSYGEHENSDSMTVGIVALADTSLTSSIYGTVRFNLTFFNEFRN
jgi:hypothetical protein